MPGYRLPDRHARPLGSSGLPYRNAVERAYRQGSLSAGRGGAFRVLGIRFRPDRRTGLERELRLVGRVPDPLPACAPFFRARVAAQTVRSGPRFWWRALRGGSILQATAVTMRTSPRSVAGSRRSTWRWWRTAVQRRLALHSSDARKIAGGDPRPAPGTCADGASLEIRAEPPCVGRAAEKRRRSGGRRRVHTVATDDREEIVPLADTVRRYEAWWRGID